MTTYSASNQELHILHPESYPYSLTSKMNLIKVFQDPFESTSGFNLIWHIPAKLVNCKPFEINPASEASAAILMEELN